MQNNKIILALDSTNSPLAAAISAGGRVFSARKAGIKQEEYLFPLLNKLLAKAGVRLNDVQKVFFIKGPGRFTGIRISITLAAMLGELCGADVASASVFDVLKHQADAAKIIPPGSAVAIIAHAFREEYFVSLRGEDKWLNYDDMLALLASVKEPLFIIGRGKDGGELKNILPAKYTYAPAKFNTISPRAMLDYASACPPQQRAQALEPLYLKPARFETDK